MSTNLSTDSGPASNPNPAASTSTDSPQTSAANAADVSAGQETIDAASGPDAFAKLDAEYKNALAPKEDGEAKPVVEPKPEPEKVEAKPEDEPVEVTEPVEVDELEELTEPRTIEQLKKQFPRVSDKPLEEIARVEAAHHALQQKVDSIGGDVGLEIAQTLVPVLLTPPTKDGNEADKAFQVMTETNPALMQEMSWSILTHALNETAKDASGLPINVVTGNAIIKQFLNEKYDVASLEKLIAYDEAGLLDHEELATELESFTGKSKREVELEERLKALETGKEQEKAAETTKSEARIQQHVAKTEDYVSKGAMTQIVAIAEEYGWTATKEELASSDPAVKQLADFKVALGALLTPWLDFYTRNHVKWGGIESLGKQEQAFNADGNPTKLLKSNGDSLINAAVAAFKEKVRTMNPVIKKVVGSSRAVKLKEKTTRSGAVEPSEIPPLKKPESNGNRPLNDEFSRLDDEYRRAVRG